MPGSKPHHVVHEPDCSNNCGYASSNQRHHESYWEGRSDPRARQWKSLKCFTQNVYFVFNYFYVLGVILHYFFKEDKSMMFSDHYYKVVDRQIAENHSTQCSGNATAGEQSNIIILIPTSFFMIILSTQ